MTGELRASRRHFSTEHLLKERDADVFEVRDHPFPLRIETADEPDGSGVAERYPQGLHQLAENRHYVRFAMSVTMRIDVGRRAAKEAFELVQLPPELGTDRCGIPQIEYALILAPHVPVKTDRESGIIAAHRDCFSRGPSGHHETGAGEYAADMAIDNASIHSG